MVHKNFRGNGIPYKLYGFGEYWAIVNESIDAADATQNASENVTGRPREYVWKGRAVMREVSQKGK